MAAAHDDNDPGFWPGYVAAISGLVQGLLIMAMALGISIFAISQLAKRAARAAGDGQSHYLAQSAQLDHGLRSRVGDGSLRAPTVTAPLEPAAKSALPPIRIAFLGDATVTPASSASLIGAAIEARQSQGAARWRVEGHAVLDDPRARRAGYLRLMGVRAVLMGLGIAGDDIDMALLEAGAEEASGDAVVLIKPLVPGGASIEGGAGQ